MKRIAVNKCLGHLRSGWHRLASRPGLDEPAEGMLLEGSDEGRAAERPGGEKDLELALGLISPVARTVVWLHDVEGYNHREIAGLFGKSESFSKTRLSRARARLRELLQADSGIAASV